MTQAPEEIVIKLNPSGELGEWEDSKKQEISEGPMFGQVKYIRKDIYDHMKKILDAMLEIDQDNKNLNKNIK